MKTKSFSWNFAKTSILFALMCMVPLCSHAAGVHFLSYLLHDGDKYDSSNCNYIKSGKISYDDTNKVVTLDNLVIDTEEVPNAVLFIQYEDKITIRLVGESNFTRKAYGIYISESVKSVTIESEDGTGSLKIDSGSEEALIYINSEKGALLTIRNCTLDVSGKYGMEGYCNGSDSETVDLVIDNATVKAKGSEYEVWGLPHHHGSIVNFRTFTLNNCYISQPAGAVYGYDDDHENAYGIYTIDSDGKPWITAEQVVILPGIPEGIASPVASGYGDGQTYNLAGQRVNENAKGILIRNHRKFIAK